MKRLPLVPTLVVALAAAAMIALGIWQLDRARTKAALLAQLSANQSLPAIAFPRFPQGDALLFRRASAFCLEVTEWRSRAGRDAAGQSGWRAIARCRTGAEGPGFAVQMGIASDPNARPGWRGGKVSGFISHAPTDAPVIARMFGAGAPELMLVADTPAPGLRANAPADLSAVPNNHLAYAVQWFVFAAIAVAIYLVALRRRRPGDSEA